MSHIESVALKGFDVFLDLCRFSTIDDLKSLVTSLEGVDAVEPVRIQSSDGDIIVSVQTWLDLTSCTNKQLDNLN